VVVRSAVVAVAVGMMLLPGCSSTEDAGVVSSALGQSEEKPAPDAIKDAPMPRISSGTHLAAGRMLEGQGNTRGAIEQYERAIASNPRFVMAYNALGVLYQKLERSEEAEQVFKRGTQADSGAAILWNNLGYCYLEQGRFEAAEKQFREALSSSPDFQRARMNLAIALGQQGQMRESLVEFSRVVPADVAYCNMAAICLSREDYVSAERALRQALVINPDCPDAKGQLEQVAAVVRAMGERGHDSALAEATVQTAEGLEPGNAEGVEVVPLAGSADGEGNP